MHLNLVRTLFLFFYYVAKIGGILGVTKKTILAERKCTILNISNLVKYHLNSILFFVHSSSNLGLSFIFSLLLLKNFSFIFSFRLQPIRPIHPHCPSTF